MTGSKALPPVACGVLEQSSGHGVMPLEYGEVLTSDNYFSMIQHSCFMTVCVNKACQSI